MIPYGRQDISQSDIDSVVDVLRSDYLTQGPVIPAFEKALVSHTGARFAKAVNSATSALHIACLALDLEPGNWLWTTPNTFVASANCALYCGARVDFVDIDPRTYNMCPLQLERKLKLAEETGTLPKVVVVVHFAGQACPMIEFHMLAQRYGFKIIEDASHAIGGKYRGEPIGNCRYSEITVFSFHPVKIVTTAEGGAALTNSEEIAERLELFRSHGITRRDSLMTRESDGPWYYEQIELGLNYRITDMQAALGMSQMGRLENYVTRRHHLARRYDVLLSDLPVVTPYQHPDAYSGLHLYPIRLRLGEIGKSRRLVFEGLRARGVGVNVHYIPVHTQPYYQSNFGFKQGDFPEAEHYYAEAITLPLYPKLTEEQQDYVVSCLRAELAP